MGALQGIDVLGIEALFATPDAVWTAGTTRKQNAIYIWRRVFEKRLAISV